MMHAIFVFQGAVRGILAYESSGDKLYDYQCGYATEQTRWYEAVTAGYMFYDFWVSVRAYGFTMQGVFPSLMLHHINILICFAFGLKFNIGFYFMLNFMTNEMSQPFLHTSWIFSKIGVPQKHPLMIVNGLLLFTTWMGSRFFFNLYILYVMVTKGSTFDPRNVVGLGTLCAIVHVGVNAYWCYLMLQQVVALIKGKPTGPKPSVVVVEDNIDRSKKID
jgi:hypothetical protein